MAVHKINTGLALLELADQRKTHYPNNITINARIRNNLGSQAPGSVPGSECPEF